MQIKHRDKVVKELAVEAAYWTRLSKQMAWAFRKGATEAPEIFTRFTGVKTMPAHADWMELRRDVLSERRRQAYQERRRKAVIQAEQRREYMRGYMRKYRKELRV
jgi:hypothetical protein